MDSSEDIPQRAQHTRCIFHFLMHSLHKGSGDRCFRLLLPPSGRISYFDKVAKVIEYLRPPLVSLLHALQYVHGRGGLTHQPLVLPLHRGQYVQARAELTQG